MTNAVSVAVESIATNIREANCDPQKNDILDFDLLLFLTSLVSHLGFLSLRPLN